MKKVFLVLILLLSFSNVSFGQVENFKLTDAISGTEFELSNHPNAKGIVLVFTSLTCPFSKLYDDRLARLHASFAADGFVFVLINPNTASDEEENKDAIQNWANATNFPFPFLMDDAKHVAKSFGITKLPEVVVITPRQTGNSIAYRGAIDNNPQMPANANIKYLESALTAIQNNKNPSPASSRAVGCNLRLN